MRRNPRVDLGEPDSELAAFDVPGPRSDRELTRARSARGTTPPKGVVAPRGWCVWCEYSETVEDADGAVRAERGTYATRESER